MQEWKSFSNVVIELADYADDDECVMKVTQTNLPDGVNKNDLRNGWLHQIFKPMSMLCGYPIINED